MKKSLSQISTYRVKYQGGRCVLPEVGVLPYFTYLKNNVYLTIKKNGNPEIKFDYQRERSTKSTV